MTLHSHKYDQGTIEPTSLSSFLLISKCLQWQQTDMGYFILNTYECLYVFTNLKNGTNIELLWVEG